MKPPTEIPGVVIRRNEPLARHFPFRTGGTCDAFVVVHDPDRLIEALGLCRREQWALTVIGAGTRSVVRDGALAGAMLRLGTGFSTIVRDGTSWVVGAAVPVPALCAAAGEGGQRGLEDLAGVPGSLGASLMADLDAPWAGIVESVRFLWRGRACDGALATLRECGPRAIVLGATLRLAEVSDRCGPRKKARTERTALPGAWVLGPKSVGLRDLLDRASMGDVRLRDVAIPASAPEMVVNLGRGTARDLALLHQSLLARVARDCGVELQSRVSFIGRA